MNEVHYDDAFLKAEPNLEALGTPLHARIWRMWIATTIDRVWQY